MNTSPTRSTGLTHSTGFWLLPILSLASAGIGGWLAASQISTMTSTLLANTATGVEVYVGQSLVVVGSALLAAGVLGLLLTFALVAVRAMMPSPAPAHTPALDESIEDGEFEPEEAATTAVSPTGSLADGTTDKGESSPAETAGAGRDIADDTLADEEGQNGSSGSTATATKISVK